MRYEGDAAVAYLQRAVETLKPDKQPILNLALVFTLLQLARGYIACATAEDDLKPTANIEVNNSGFPDPKVLAVFTRSALKLHDHHRRMTARVLGDLAGFLVESAEAENTSEAADGEIDQMAKRFGGNTALAQAMVDISEEQREYLRRCGDAQSFNGVLTVRNELPGTLVVQHARTPFQELKEPQPSEMNVQGENGYRMQLVNIPPEAGLKYIDVPALEGFQSDISDGKANDLVPVTLLVGRSSEGKFYIRGLTGGSSLQNGNYYTTSSFGGDRRSYDSVFSVFPKGYDNGSRLINSDRVQWDRDWKTLSVACDKMLSLREDVCMLYLQLDLSGLQQQELEATLLQVQEFNKLLDAVQKFFEAGLENGSVFNEYAFVIKVREFMSTFQAVIAALPNDRIKEKFRQAYRRMYGEMEKKAKEISDSPSAHAMTARFVPPEVERTESQPNSGTQPRRSILNMLGLK